MKPYSPRATVDAAGRMFPVRHAFWGLDDETVLVFRC